jgi:PAS domain S-box-containing protein
MSSSAPAPDDVLRVFNSLGSPGTPFTTTEVAAHFDCTDRTVYNKLEILVDEGHIETKKVGARGRVWWRPVPVNTTNGGEVGGNATETSGNPAENGPRTQQDFAEDPLSTLSGDSEMIRRTREFDWSETPVGPAADWPNSLKTAVEIMLTSRYPMLIWWGDELIHFYNDAYIPVLGERHPDALGQPAPEVWSEAWPTVGPQAEAVMEDADSSWNEEMLITMTRNGYPEEVYMTFSYSPIFDDEGEVGGVFCACTEETQRVLGQRRLGTLRQLAGQALQGETVEETFEISAETLAENPADVPFAALYQIDDESEQAHISGTAGLDPGDPNTPATVDLSASSGPDTERPTNETDPPRIWPVARVARTGEAEHIDDVEACFGALPGGEWPEPPQEALVLPIIGPGRERPYGVLVAGVSPRRRLNDDYRSFFDLAVGHIGTAATAARAYEEERKRAEELAELDRAKTTFFNNVSHEFRTPLTLMLGPLEDALAEADETLPPEQRERIEVVHRSSQRLLKLVNTLLDFSRIEAGRTQASYEPTDLADVTADLASTFRAAIERADMELSVDTPPLSDPVYVDRDMWEKVVLNLLSNAFKHTFEGEISVSVRATDGHAELEVRDTGTGIPEEDIPTLFDRFHQVEGTRSRSHEGSGIGLALVQDLVDFHDGDITVESTVGEGSTFTVRVPLGTTHLPDDQIEADQTLASTAVGAGPYVEEALRWLPDDEMPAVEGGASDAIADTAPRQVGLPAPGARVLVADDNTDMRAYLGRLLGKQWDVETVPDGHAALAAVKESPPDLVLADVMMPDLDGFELLEALREDAATQEIPVVMLSARADEESRVAGLEAGADDYVVKPFSARELVARVGATLELSQVRTDAEREIREAKKQLEVALDAGGMGTWRWDLGAGTVDGDERFAELFDLHPADDPRPVEDFLKQQSTESTVEAESVMHTEFEPGETVQGEACLDYVDDAPKWLSWRSQASSDDPSTLYGVSYDITEQKRRDVRQRFLVELSDALQSLTDPEKIMATSAELLGTELDVSQVGYTRAGADEDSAVAGGEYGDGRMPDLEDYRFTLSDYSDEFQATLRSGEAIFFEDFESDHRTPEEGSAEAESIGIRAGAMVPLHRDGQLLAWLYAAHPEPRQWPEHERRLFREVLDRTWAAVEQARAQQKLRESEEKFQAVANLVPDLLWSNGADGSTFWYNQQWDDYTGQTLDEGAEYGWIDAIHPEDREESLKHFKNAVDTGTPVQRELRIRRHDGQYRWFLVRARPAEDDAESTRWFGTATDIHEHRMMTAVLDRLNKAVRELIDADPDTIRDRVAVLTREVLDVEYAALWRYDEATGEVGSYASETDTAAFPDGIEVPEGFGEHVWQTFIGDELSVDNEVPVDEEYQEPSLQSWVLAPLGRYGVICVGSTQPGQFDEELVDFVEMVAATVERAWDRADGERQLARQNEDLTRLDRLNTLIRGIDKELVRADTIEDIDEAVCEQVADSALYEFAWVGTFDADAEAVRPRAWAGIEGSTAKKLSTVSDHVGTITDPFATAIQTREMQVVADIATDSRTGSWREVALEHGARSCLSIPLVYEKSVYGVFVVYGDVPSQNNRGSNVLKELGQTIAHAINAVETRETSRTHSIVELTLRSTAADFPLCQLARDTDSVLDFEGLATGSHDEATVFFTAADVPVEKIVAASEELLAIKDTVHLADRDGNALFKARVTDPLVATHFLDGNATIQSLTIDAGTATAVVNLPESADVREFVERVTREVSDLEFLSRQSRTPSRESVLTSQTSLTSRLTPRQQEILQLAYRSGFFESPRVQTGKELSDILDLSQSTFNYHLRGAERKLCEAVFDHT